MTGETRRVGVERSVVNERVAVVVGYWRFGAVPRAVPVVWNSIHVLQHWLHMTLVVATIFYSTRHWYNVSRIVLRDR